MVTEKKPGLFIPYALVGTIVTVFITVGAAWSNIKGDVRDMEKDIEHGKEKIDTLAKEVKDILDNVTTMRIEMGKLSTLIGTRHP